MRARWVQLLLAILLTGAVPSASATERAQQSGSRYFAETGYGVANDKFWDYFQKRGGLKTFGYPTSREAVLQGCTVQFFQRTVMQVCNRGVQTINLLDREYLPYTTMNGSTFPAPDPSVIRETPPPDQADKVVEFTKRMAPDVWEGKPVNFFKTFSNTVTYDVAFPNGEGSASLLPLINLEIWGAPTSKPEKDPNNFDFVYQRFQRGIMHYDDKCKCTQGLLLADYLKSLMTGQNVPADLASQASGSPLFRVYNSGAGDGLAKSGSPPNSNLKQAFEKQSPSEFGQSASSQASSPPPSSQSAPPAAEPRPTATPQPASSSSGGSRSSGAGRVKSPEYGMNVFVWGAPDTTGRDLKKVVDAGFGWQKTLFQWREIEPKRGEMNFDESDRVVRASKDAGVKIIARLDFQPDWARGAKSHNGPPDRYEDYANFVGKLVERYSSNSRIGTIHAIEIWNEPNLDREWGDQVINQQQAGDYVRLLRLAYQAAKSADPNVIVITAGLSPTCTDNNQARPDDVYTQWMYDAGAKQYFDVLGAHGAGYDKPPSASPEESASKHSGCRVFTFRRIEDLRKVMERNGDSDKQIWLLEFGWTSDPVHPDYGWFRVSEDTKADYLVGAYQWANKNWAPWIGVMTLWNLPDPGWTEQREEYWWSIAFPDGRNRPAYDRLLKARKEGALP